MQASKTPLAIKIIIAINTIVGVVSVCFCLLMTSEIKSITEPKRKTTKAIIQFHHVAILPNQMESVLSELDSFNLAKSLFLQLTIQLFYRRQKRNRYHLDEML